MIMWKNYKILVLLILLIGCYTSKAQMFSYDFATIFGSFDFKFPSILADASFVDVGNTDQPKYKNPENVSKFYRAVILALILIASRSLIFFVAAISFKKMSSVFFMSLI